MTDKVTVRQLQAMKHTGEKIVGIVVWDSQLAAIADRVGADIVSVGDSVGINLWGQSDPLSVTLEQLITLAHAARAGTTRALLSCDLPENSLQQGLDATVAAARRLVAETGIDMIKLDRAAECPQAVTALAEAGIEVWAQFGVTPTIAAEFGVAIRNQAESSAEMPAALETRLVTNAKALAAAGAALLDFKNSGPTAGAAVTAAVDIPVLGGYGGGPWLDGRVRMAHAALGYDVRALDEDLDNYANVARTAFDALTELCADIRAGRQIRGAPRNRT